MASNVFNGTNLLLKVAADGGTPVVIGHSTSASLSLSHDLPEATTKDSAGFAEHISGLRSAEISFEGLVSYTDTQNIAELTDFILNRTKLDWTLATTTTGDQILTGEGFLASAEVSSEMESPVTYSGSITCTGAITSGSVS
ncbi:MAG: putative tail tube protein [Prokaryotic dsDNA virus sp.]|nr:MAG: putative tail tube protein [Prokaryotic dsDNA virus sp.]|tara:strand:- start:22529 stop:22951 length:423 start_codon:yes stop_codon:yes gene_type:complete